MEEIQQLSLRELAEIRKISVQAIYQELKKENNVYSKYLIINDKGQKFFNKDILNEFNIKEEEEIKETKEETSSSNKSQELLIETLMNQNQLLQEQLQIKDKQIESLQVALNQNQELLGNQQKLLAFEQSSNNLLDSNNNEEGGNNNQKRGIFSWFRK